MEFVTIEDQGRIIVEEFKGGSDITQGGQMELSLTERQTCSAPTRIQGTLLFKDGEPVKDGEQRYA